jgi:type II secretory pathway predicted ATPase ExeA
MATKKKARPSIEISMKAFFGFKSLPFAKNLEADQVLLTNTHQKAIDRLRYLADRQGIGTLIGAPGTGKSTVLRAFLATLGRTTHAVCYIHETTCAVLDLYRSIARGFHLEPRHRKADVMKDLREQLLRLSRAKKTRPVLIIDEAHLLPSNFLDELRLITNFDEDARDEMTLILAGHIQLESHLSLAINEALSQRIVQRIRLRSLHPTEVADYINFRLEHAGRTAPIFLPDAIEAISKASRGIPRIIDRLGEHALLIALKDKHNDIDAELIMEAVEEIEP